MESWRSYLPASLRDGQQGSILTSTTTTAAAAGAILPLAILVAALLLLFFVSPGKSSSSTTLPKSLPWISRRNDGEQAGSSARSFCDANFEQALVGGYVATSTTNAPLFDTTQFTRKDKPSVLATRDGEIVILPASVLEWAVAQPETVLSKTAADRERLHPEYTFPRPEILDQHQSQGRAATDTLLTSDALLQPQILPMLFDELRSAVDELLDGSDVTTTTTTTRGGFNTVVLHQTISEIVARAWNRALVGLPTCRNDEYIRSAIKYSDNLATTATSLRKFSILTRPAFASWVTSSVAKSARAFVDILTPEIQRRKSQKSEDAEETDVLQWLLARSPDEADAELIAARLLHLNAECVSMTSFLATNALFDVLAAPQAERVEETLRREATETMASSSPSVDKLRYLDSALRESARRSNVVGVSMVRKVVAKGGVTLPDGTRLPDGCMVGVNSLGCHSDESIYAGAAKYKPFRFIEASPASSHPRQFTDTYDPGYLVFGFGPGAWAGRFIAAAQLKFLLAYLFSRYDIQMVMEGGIGGNWNGKGVRPENSWVGPDHVPPESAKVKVRRRKDI